MTATYRAAICTSLTGPQAITIEDLPVRPLAAGEVRIRVAAAGLNFPDLLMTRGEYQFRPEPPFTLGLEAAGEVIEVADDVRAVQPGDRVMAGSKGGAIAEQWIVDHSAISPLPEALSFAEGACWATAAATAWNALIARAQLVAGENLLVLGASGGVGMAAVKLAKSVGAMVIGSGSTAEKRTAIIAAGADHALDPADPDFAKQVKALTAGHGVDVVYDPVGGPLAITATRAIAWNGRYLVIGFASGTVPTFPANHILIKTYSIIGVRAGESPRRDPLLAKRQSEALAQLAAAGEMRPLIDRRLPLEETVSAFELLEQRQAIGRIVIKI